MNDKATLSKIREMCARGSELIPLSILCNSVGSMGMRDPVIVDANESLAVCVEHLARHKTGSVLIADENEHLIGIFTERDCILKVVGRVHNLETATVGSFMTPNPVSERPDTTIAFALNLMSHGGFRNLPIVDDARHPIGVVSVKDIVDYLVLTMLSSIEDATPMAEGDRTNLLP